LQEFREAAWEFSVAEAWHELGNYAKAEPQYRAALAKFERLGFEDRLVDVWIRLAIMIADRGGETRDFREAEQLLFLALDDLDRDAGRDATKQRRQALEVLRRVYGPDALNAPSKLDETDAQIQLLDAPPPTPGLHEGLKPLG
jgi:tetratricopeptide (TPR) repeat protein